MDSLGDDGFSMTNKVATAFRVAANKQQAVPSRTRDKSDRATVEQVSSHLRPFWEFETGFEKSEILPSGTS